MKALIAAILLVASSVAAAAPGGHGGGAGGSTSGTSSSGSGTPGVGSASNNDVTLGTRTANSFTLSSGNAQAGANGSSGVFSSAFGGSNWNLLSKVDSTGSLTGTPASVLGSNISLTFNLASDKKSGTWSITSSKSLQLDLVLGIHASDATGSFLFSNLALNAGRTQTGSFAIRWNNNGGNVPDYSNLTLFYSNASTLRTVAAVPEPSTYAMLLAGLAMVGGLAWRRRRRDGEGALAA